MLADLNAHSKRHIHIFLSEGKIDEISRFTRALGDSSDDFETQAIIVI